MDVDHTLNLGGLETFPTFFPDPDDIDPHFEGCMRNLKLNGKEYPLTVEAGWRGLSIGKLVTDRMFGSAELFSQTFTLRFGPNDRTFFCRTQNFFFVLHSMPMASFHIFVLLNDPNVLGL